MEELFTNPAGVRHWERAHKREAVDWDALFSGYQAVVDFPGSMYYKQLADHYPEAKVILTVRDADRWYESVKATIYSFDPGVRMKLKLLFSMPFSATARNVFKVIKLNDLSIWKTLFSGRFEDKEYAIDLFNRHIEEVQQTIPAQRLLVFEAKQGWEPLCAFLDKEVPDEPYPRTNKKQNFDEYVQSILSKVL